MSYFINLIPLPVIFLDRNFLTRSWNRAAEQTLLLTEKEHLSQPIDHVFSYPDLITKLKTQTTQLSSPAVPLTYLNMDLSLSLIDDTKEGYLLVIENVTKIHHLERIRQDFLANVSHELRTPLTVLHGYLEILLTKTDNNLAPYHQIFEQMYQQSTRMESLVKDLLLLSHLENDIHGEERFEIVDVFSLIKKICADAKALSGTRKHNIMLDADPNLKIYGLESGLVSVFANLIFNAVNYTPANGSIHIVWKKQGHTARFTVTDTGIGIEKKHIHRITERFYRVDKARSRDSGGTGLGLAIVKHVLLLHHATLTIESQPGQGSIFSCIFPEACIRV